MKSPERILVQPVYALEYNLIKSQKLKRDIYIPKKAEVDIDDVFNGQSHCLIDYLIQANDGETAFPIAIINTVKEGVTSTTGGWVSQYTTNCKTTSIIYETRKKEKQTCMKRPGRQQTQIVQLADIDDEHCSPGPNEVTLPTDWDESEKSGGETEMDGSGDDVELVKKINMKEDDKKDITQKVANYIDVNRYYVFTSAKENQVSALWKDREKKKNWAKYQKAVQKLKAIPTQTRALHASFTIKSSQQGGWKECADRAREWQQWHSVVGCILGNAFPPLIFHLGSQYSVPPMRGCIGLVRFNQWVYSFVPIVLTRTHFDPAPNLPSK